MPQDGSDRLDRDPCCARRGAEVGGSPRHAPFLEDAPEAFKERRG